MTADEIKAEIAAGRISAITLDTSAFGKPSEMSLEYGLVARLGQFSGTGVQFILSDVVLKEVESHMTKGANDAILQLDKSFKAVGGSWNVPREIRAEAKKILVGDESPLEMARRRVEAFVDDTKCLVIKSDEHATIGELVRRYFSNEPPFAERETKKNEFPDALAVMSLEAWAKEHDTKILVVSNDEDWARYCETSRGLVMVRNLADGLALFNANGEVACIALSQIMLSGERTDWQEAIERAAQSHIDSMWFMAEADAMFHFDDEINEVVVLGVVISDDELVLAPVDTEDGSLVAELTVSVEVEVSCDFSFSVRDSIDKDYVPMGSATLTGSDTIELRMLITFAGDIPDDAEIDEIEVEGNNRHYISFGTVGPDWMDDSSNYEE